MTTRLAARRLVLLIIPLILFLALARPPSLHADGPSVYPDTGNFITTFCLFADGFRPYENVALWVELANGAVQPAVPFSTTNANSQGQLGQRENDLLLGFGCFFDPGDGSWVNGQTKIVARGLKSGHEASAYFTYKGQSPDPDGSGVHLDTQIGPPVDQPWWVGSGAGMRPYSRVSLWLGQPDGTSIPNPFFSETFANERGEFYFQVFRGPLTQYGEYRVVASDGQHEYSNTFNFIQNDANTINSPTGTGFVANPSGGPYGTFFANRIGGFTPYETVDIWIEVPNGAVVTEVNAADEQGIVSSFWQALVGEPVGDYLVHAKGRTSKVQVDGKFTVIDMIPSP